MGATYPGLRNSTYSDEALRYRYGSRAAAFYRVQLQRLCNDSADVDTTEAPSAEEGHLEAQLERYPTDSCDIDKDSSDGEVETDQLSLEEERAAFEVAYQEYERRPKDSTNQAASSSRQANC